MDRAAGCRGCVLCEVHVESNERRVPDLAGNPAPLVGCVVVADRRTLEKSRGVLHIDPAAGLRLVVEQRAGVGHREVRAVIISLDADSSTFVDCFIVVQMGFLDRAICRENVDAAAFRRLVALQSTPLHRELRHIALHVDSVDVDPATTQNGAIESDQVRLFE